MRPRLGVGRRVPTVRHLLGVVAVVGLSVLTSGCTLWGWGVNTHGQVGNGTTTQQISPAQVGATTWKVLSAGGTHTCGIRTDTTLWCWGNNDFGAVGNGGTVTQSAPVVVSGTSTTWKAVAASDGGHTCGIRTNDTLWCWGRNDVRPDRRRHHHRCGPPRSQVGTATLEVGRHRLRPHLRDPQRRHPLVLGEEHRRRARRRHHHQPHHPRPGRHRDLEDRRRRQLPHLRDPDQRHPLVLGRQRHRRARRRHHHRPRPARCRSAPRPGRRSPSAGYQQLRRSAATAPCGAGAATATARSATAPPPTATAPVQVGTATWKTVSAGRFHTCGTRSDDTLWCWGHNRSARSATAPPPAAPAPSQIGTGDAGRASAAAASTPAPIRHRRHPAGAGATTAPASSATARTISRTAPAAGRHARRWKQASAGGIPQLRVARPTAPCGAGATTASGQLGDGTTDRPDQPGPGRHRHLEDRLRRLRHDLRDPQPTTRSGAGAATSFGQARRRRRPPTGPAPCRSAPPPGRPSRAGYAHTCGVQSDDTLWCWGDNGRGQRRRRHHHLFGTGPVQIGTATWKTVSAGLLHTCGIQSDDTPLVLGRQRPRPARRRHHHRPHHALPRRDRHVDDRHRRSGTTPAGSRADDALWCWGNNFHGQLGDTTTATRTQPGADRHRHLEDGRGRREPHVRHPHQRHALVLGSERRRPGR